MPETNNIHKNNMKQIYLTMNDKQQNPNKMYYYVLPRTYQTKIKFCMFSFS